MQTTILKNGTIINEGKIEKADIVIEGDKIKEIGTIDTSALTDAEVIDCTGKHIIPGVIDDQVHFREPGMVHKGEIGTESQAALAGGVTSYMEMPNTSPQTTNQKAIEAKFERAAEKSYCNYSFYIGATNDNIDDLLATDKTAVCGVKVFMGSSTGNMLVDNDDALNNIFSKVKMPIATHCEDEATIKANIQKYVAQNGEVMDETFHPLIRSHEACFKSSSKAFKLAKKHGTRLHILHLSTAEEAKMLENDVPSSQKQITGEVCVHHLFFNDQDYKKHGYRIRWNPSVKTQADQEELFAALLDGRIDVIATDHAPHLLEEKSNEIYTKRASGGPLVQHSLVTMLKFYQDGKISLEKVIDKMCHAPADIFNIKERGYLRQGYKADIAVIDLNTKWTVSPENILYKCNWSPFEGTEFGAKVWATFVNGQLAFKEGKIVAKPKVEALSFSR